MTRPSHSAGIERQRLAVEIEQRRRARDREHEAPPLWTPFPGSPQELAYMSEADELFYGGAAGGGKTDLLIGLALTAHANSIIFRREYPQLKAIEDRARSVIGSRGKYNGQTHTWRDLPGGRTLEFGAVQYEENRERYQGRPHDLKCFDELPHFNRSQYRYLIGWTRTSVPGQRCRVVSAGNPPTPNQGQWVVEEWAPWLDPAYPDPAGPGELRWYAMLDDILTWVDSGEPFEHTDKSGKTETVTPKSRTFIPARVDDNPVYAHSGYKATLQSMPEPLRSQLLYGDFNISANDDPWQVIPTAWVQRSQERWKKIAALIGARHGVGEAGWAVPGTMLTLGMDVAHGGKDKTVFAPLYHPGQYHSVARLWMGELTAVPGLDTPDGKAAATAAVEILGPFAVAHVDAIGYGASAAERLIDPPPLGFGKHAVAVNVASGSDYMDKSGKFPMRNLRAEMYWRLREALDPEGDILLALPPDQEMLADLCQPRYEITVAGIKIEPKSDIRERLGRSPDKGDAVALAMLPRTSRTGASAGGAGLTDTVFDMDMSRPTPRPISGMGGVAARVGGLPSGPESPGGKLSVTEPGDAGGRSRAGRAGGGGGRAGGRGGRDGGGAGFL